MADGSVNQPQQRDKRQVAASFSKAASSYDQVAHLQRKLGDELLTMLGDSLTGPVLDLGAGTGYFSLEMAQAASTHTVVAADLAAGMLQFARQQRGHPKIAWLQADAESLPLASASQNVVFANLSIQWIEQPTHLFCEVERVLKPGGCFAFTTLGPGTLNELREAWKSVDDHSHVNDFIEQSALLAKMPANLRQQQFRVYPEVIHYQRLQDLLVELKGIGAQNRNQGRPQGLGGAARLQKLVRGYDLFRDGQGLLPATYEVYSGVFVKEVPSG